ncbi:MAG: triose-phosphate isomerase [Balneolaceae bacterium]|nr:triose-phosphate isomerase [Balneolaceae bacterium]
MRNFLIAGNWKMNCGPQETTELLSALKKQAPNISEQVEVLVCPPTISLSSASEVLSDFDACMLGAQNVHSEDNGAYTGEVSTSMLKEVGCVYVIVGHSERREYFGETDITVNAKVSKALSDSLKVIICVGESLGQRKKGTHIRMVKKQVQAALNGINEDKIANVVIAYEPIWAIGTGETATPDQAQEMHEMIRETVGNLYSEKKAESTQVLYGGSMKPHNAEELLSQPDVDGGLIGGASLKAESFAEIIKIAERVNN